MFIISAFDMYCNVHLLNRLNFSEQILRGRGLGDPVEDVKYLFEQTSTTGALEHIHGKEISSSSTSKYNLLNLVFTL